MAIVGGTYKLNSGHEIPLVGFGTYQIKGQEAISVSIDAALGAGYRLIDTAKAYGNEKEIGNALQEFLPKYNLKRADVFITTKVLLTEGDNRKATREAFEESLKFLQTDYVNLVLIHYPGAWGASTSNDGSSNATYRKDSYEELEKLQAEGKIHSIGVSNYEIRHIEELKKYAKVQPAANQCEFHPHFTRNELREYCKKENIFFQQPSGYASYIDPYGNPMQLMPQQQMYHASAGGGPMSIMPHFAYMSHHKFPVVVPTHSDYGPPAYHRDDRRPPPSTSHRKRSPSPYASNGGDYKRRYRTSSDGRGRPEQSFSSSRDRRRPSPSRHRTSSRR
uniref:NADP-dependent oxidoreductase domain-containing protein n=1 Tax=Plectus sambesii TaxID=2011161 RepID=A0A914X0G3_9BILA